MPKRGRSRDVSNRELLEQVALTHGPATSGEIADGVSIGRKGVNKRLPDLVDRGLLHRKQVGANAIIYWLTEDGHAELRGGE
jgi:predicted ArsR family transcriptional regulator